MFGVDIADADIETNKSTEVQVAYIILIKIQYIYPGTGLIYKNTI